jgi:hypothetical protein
MDFTKLTETMSPIQFDFVKAILVVYLTVGGLGNIISIIIFNTKLNRKQRVTVFLNSSFVMNLVTIGYFPIMLLAPIWMVNKSTCMIFPGIFTFIIKIQAWIVAIGSLDRLISNYKPNICFFKNNYKFQLMLLVIIMLFLALISFPEVLYIARPSFYNNKTICVYGTDENLIWLPIYYLIECLLFRIILPFSIIIVSNYLVILKICKKITRFTKNRQHHNRLLKSLIASDILFAFFRLPMLCYTFMKADSATNRLSFTYSAFLAFGLISNVLSCLIMVIFNKDYRKLIFNYRRKKKESVKKLVTSSLNLNTITQEMASIKY